MSDDLDKSYRSIFEESVYGRTNSANLSSIDTFNVGGLTEHVKRSYLMDGAKAYKIDLCCIQETENSKQQVSLGIMNVLYVWNVTPGIMAMCSFLSPNWWANV